MLRNLAADVSGNLLAWFRYYLSDRKQRVLLPGISSDWSKILAGVPPGSILGPLLLFIFINDTVNEIGSFMRFFADDTSQFVIVDYPVSFTKSLNDYLVKILLWAETWQVTFNPNKTESLIISFETNRPIHPPYT